MAISRIGSLTSIIQGAAVCCIAKIPVGEANFHGTRGRRARSACRHKAAGTVLASPLVAYQGCAASQSVVQRAPVGVEFLRHPVDRGRLHAIRCSIHSVYQGTTDSASACCRIDEQIFEVTVVLQRPGGRMKHVMDESY